jgi:hypothetical protein
MQLQSVKIRDDSNSYYGSVGALTGIRGVDKTFTAPNEVITISYEPQAHLIIYREEGI